MNLFEINAEPRGLQGKGASRRLRRDGKVPGIVYGAGKPPVAIELSHNILKQQLAHEAFYSHVLTLKLAGASERVVLKDLQRHPFKPVVLHLDLLRVSEEEKLTMRVPVHFLNEESCVGVKRDGGTVSHLVSEIEVQCLPRDLPEFITVDLAAVEAGQTLHLSDIQLPPGLEPMAAVHGEDPAVVSVNAPRGGGGGGESGGED